MQKSHSKVVNESGGQKVVFDLVDLANVLDWVVDITVKRQLAWVVKRNLRSAMIALVSCQV